MKTIQEQRDDKLPVAEVDPSLDKYRDYTPFPAKLAIAKEALRTAKLPQRTLSGTNKKLKHETP